MNKVTYTGNDLAREVPTMREPDQGDDMYYTERSLPGFDNPITFFSTVDYKDDVAAYKEHIASLQTFPVLTPHNWIEGREYEEGRDYERTSSVMFEHEGEKVYDWDTVLQPIVKEARKVCYCGSLRVAVEAFKKAEYESVLKGEIALLPCNIHVERNYTQDSDYKKKADELHKRKIDIADEVFILNVGGYIGESTKSELNYALSIGKPVKYLEPLVKEASTPEPSPSLASHSCTDGNTDGHYKWITIKPTEWQECLLVAASFYNGWNYMLFEIQKIEFDNSWYWRILQDGQEWGDIHDLAADKYMMLPLLTPAPNPQVSDTTKAD